MFWKGAIGHCRSDLDVEALLDDLLLREFVLREARSSISGETAFRFKHMLISEVAYAGLSKQSRAQQHARFAEWLKERAGEELLEIRAHHLDQATQLLAELDGAAARRADQRGGRGVDGRGKRALAPRAVQVGAKATRCVPSSSSPRSSAVLRGTSGVEAG